MGGRGGPIEGSERKHGVRMAFLSSETWEICTGEVHLSPS
jgi:hypothetical protein